MKNIRLEESEINIIKESFIRHFAIEDGLWIFGSRTNPQGKGGDIDLYIETTYSDPKKIVQARLDFLTDLMLKMGEQKIDVVIKFEDIELPIYAVAKTNGIKIV